MKENSTESTSAWRTIIFVFLSPFGWRVCFCVWDQRVKKENKALVWDHFKGMWPYIWNRLHRPSLEKESSLSSSPNQGYPLRGWILWISFLRSTALSLQRTNIALTDAWRQLTASSIWSSSAPVDCSTVLFRICFDSRLVMGMLLELEFDWSKNMLRINKNENGNLSGSHY